MLGPVSDLLDDERLTLMGLFAETWTALAARLTADLARFDVSPVEFEVLLRLGRSPDRRLRMTELAAQTSLTSSGVTRVVDRLVVRGLVDRAACATDRRSTYAVATDDGLALLDAAVPGHLAVVEEWLVVPLLSTAPDGAADLASFTAALRRLRDLLVPCATAGAVPAAGPAHLPAPSVSRR
jgi:DNA-binding MarR family transcriptional regulator